MARRASERERLAAGDHARVAFSSLASTRRRSEWTKSRDTGERSSDVTTRRAVALFRSRTVRVGSWFGSARERAAAWSRWSAGGARAASGTRRGSRERGAIRASGESATGIGTGGTAGARAAAAAAAARFRASSRAGEKRASLGFGDAFPGTSGTALLRAAAAAPWVSFASGPAHMLSSWVLVTTRRVPLAGGVPRASLCGRRRRGERVWQQLVLIFPKKTRVRTRVRVRIGRDVSSWFARTRVVRRNRKHVAPRGDFARSRASPAPVSSSSRCSSSRLGTREKSDAPPYPPPVPSSLTRLRSAASSLSASMVISPEFSSDACMVFAAGPIGAAFAVFRSNCETREGGRERRRSVPQSVHRSSSQRQSPQRPRVRRVLLKLRRQRRVKG